ncbi:MAG: hypothetical protein ABI266_03345 [Ginsengibacter sp.]
MRKLFSAIAIIIFFASCSNSKVATAQSEVPSCLLTKIQQMTADQSQGEPLYVTMFNYKGNKVYYVAAACCDKYNMVFDKNCKLLGYPDGGLMGKGDGSLPNFRQEATNGKAIWAAHEKGTVDEKDASKP